MLDIGPAVRVNCSIGACRSVGRILNNPYKT